MKNILQMKLQRIMIVKALKGNESDSESSNEYEISLNIRFKKRKEAIKVYDKLKEILKNS